MRPKRMFELACYELELESGRKITRGSEDSILETLFRNVERDVGEPIRGYRPVGKWIDIPKPKITRPPHIAVGDRVTLAGDPHDPSTGVVDRFVANPEPDAKHPLAVVYWGEDGEDGFSEEDPGILSKVEKED